MVGSLFFCITPQRTVDIVVTWRDEPFLVDGQPSRVCTHTTVIYSQS